MGNIASSGPKAWPVRVLIPGTTRRTFSRLSTVPLYDQLAIEVVGRGDAGQRLHGAQRIIERHAAELSQLRASKRLLRGHAALARPEQIAADDHRLVVRGRPLGERNGDPVLSGPRSRRTAAVRTRAMRTRSATRR